MRKYCNRKRRVATSIMSPNQHCNLMIAPRLHLQMICDGQGGSHHAQSVAGIFNIVSAIAYQSGDNKFYEKIQFGQDILIRARQPDGKMVLSEEDKKILLVLFDSADRYLGVVNKAKLLKAVNFVENAIDTGKDADVIRFPTGSDDQESG